ncbi:hypothetical protein GGS21DRAFT_516636 [Xylaria nigripes]|nr:hypothetical protein GGS21DRAFT_516636 [Xylaria nigripes]
MLNDTSVGCSGSGHNRTVHTRTSFTIIPLGLTGSPESIVDRYDSRSWEAVVSRHANKSTVSPSPSENLHEFLHHKARGGCEDKCQAITDHAHGGTSNNYSTKRHPPVNALHPPILRQPLDKSTSQWMVAPPPPAKVMDSMWHNDPSVRSSTRNMSSHSSRSDDQGCFSVLQQSVQEAPNGINDGSNGSTASRGGPVASASASSHAFALSSKHAILVDLSDG